MDPTQEAPEEVVETTPDTPDTDTIDYAKRYNDLRPEFDRTKQELAQYRQIIEALSDPERAPEALSALGYEYEQDTPEEEPQYEDPTEALRSELNQIKSRLEQKEQEEAKQADLAQQLEDLAKEVGSDFDQDEVQLLVDLAERMPDNRGRPQVKAAFERLTGYEEKKKQSWVKTKRSRQAPQGQPGVPVPDTSTEAGRIDAMAAAIEASIDE